ncbi:MAG: carbohydrate ABC transporter permease, partial [Rhizobiaceae bacterium]|nr:carbohydrate ABC transporter permease [Rhizobiaceae bacterium]
MLRTAAPDTQRQEGALYVIDGNIFADNDENTNATISVWGTSSRAIADYQPGDTADMGDDGRITLQANGDYRLENDAEFSGSRGERVFVTAQTPPQFTINNYVHILFSGSTTDSMAKAFFNTLTVTIPATIIPIVV